MASNKGNAILIRILNKGIHEARKTGLLDKINTKWLGTKYGPQESFLEQCLWPLSAAAGGILLLSLCVWAWNLRLRTLVRKKTEDITLREKALRESEEKYRSLFENAIEGIYQTTQEGRYISANPALAKLFGYDSPQELMETINDIGKQHYANPKDRNTFRNTIEAEGIIKGFEVQLLKKDGTPVWVSLTSREIRNDEGEITHYEGTMEDITERKRAEEALRKSEEK